MFGVLPPLVWKSHYIVGKHAFMVVLLLSHHEKCIKDSSTKLVFIFSKVKIQHTKKIPTYQCKIMQNHNLTEHEQKKIQTGNTVETENLTSFNTHILTM